eukprot:1379440-Pyramimonas_sp.AAC.1
MSVRQRAPELSLSLPLARALLPTAVGRRAAAWSERSAERRPNDSGGRERRARESARPPPSGARSGARPASVRVA